MASFDFFRKHQKFILYTAGIFALLTFSISGAMLSYFDQLTGTGFRGATMKFGGSTVKVTLDDFRVAQRLSNPRLVPPLMPDVGGPDTSESERVEILSAVRALARHYGIEGSTTEVKEAVKHIVDVAPKTGDAPAVKASDLPRYAGMSEGEYESLQAEALRIATFLRMAALGGDVSDAALAEKLAGDLKLLTLRVATIDKKQLEERAKATAVSDDELKTWLNGLTDAEKVPFQDTNRVALKAAGVKLATFDPAQFATELAGKEYGDKVVEDRYNLDRDAYYRREKPKEGEPAPADPYLPLADVKPQVIKRMQAEDALKVILEKLRLQLGEHLQELVDARTNAARELAQKRAAQTKADTDLAAKPDDEALKKAAADAKEAVAAAEKLHKDAETAVDVRRKAFDLDAALAKATTAKLTTSAVAEPKNADGLRDLPEFAPWDGSWAAGALDLAGDVCSSIQNTKEGVFLFQVSDVIKTPLKEFDKIKEQLADAYYRKKADDAGKELATKFEDALKRLGREAKKAEIDKLEAEHASAVTQKFDAWKATAEADKANAQQKLQGLEVGSVPFQRWQDKLTRVEKELADADAKKKALEADVRKETDKKIDDVIKSARKDTLAAAAAEVGLTVDTVGPLRKDIDALPRFNEDNTTRVRFLFGNASVKEMKVGEATDLLDDATNRAQHLAVMEKIESGTVAMLSRREFAMRRDAFAQTRRTQTIAQSFTLDALRKGWGYSSASSDPDTAEAAPKTASSGAPEGQGSGTNSGK